MILCSKFSHVYTCMCDHTGLGGAEGAFAPPPHSNWLFLPLIWGSHPPPFFLNSPHPPPPPPPPLNVLALGIWPLLSEILKQKLTICSSACLYVASSPGHSQLFHVTPHAMYTIL